MTTCSCCLHVWSWQVHVVERAPQFIATKIKSVYRSLHFIWPCLLELPQLLRCDMGMWLSLYCVIQIIKFSNSIKISISSWNDMFVIDCAKLMCLILSLPLCTILDPVFQMHHVCCCYMWYHSCCQKVNSLPVFIALSQVLSNTSHQATWYIQHVWDTCGC